MFPKLPTVNAVGKAVVMTAIALAVIVFAIGVMPAAWQAKAKALLGIG